MVPLEIWQRGEFWYLAGTYVELWREHGSGLWFVIDSRRPNRRLCGDGAMSLKMAKESAFRYVEKHPSLRRK